MPPPPLSGHALVIGNSDGIGLHLTRRLLADGISDFDGLYLAMATAARNVYDLVNDPSFESSPNPPLPRSLVASYQSPAKVPGSAGATVPASSSPKTRPSSKITASKVTATRGASRNMSTSVRPLRRVSLDMNTKLSFSNAAAGIVRFG